MLIVRLPPGELPGFAGVIGAGDPDSAGLLLFFASLGVQFLLINRLFDRRLAIISCTFVLLCDTMWQYALSGLPQMLMLLLFNLKLFAMLRAV